MTCSKGNMRYIGLSYLFANAFRKWTTFHYDFIKPTHSRLINFCHMWSREKSWNQSVRFLTFTCELHENMLWNIWIFWRNSSKIPVECEWNSGFPRNLWKRGLSVKRLFFFKKERFLEIFRKKQQIRCRIRTKWWYAFKVTFCDQN